MLMSMSIYYYVTVYPVSTGIIFNLNTIWGMFQNNQNYHLS